MGARWALADVGFEVPGGVLVMVTGRNGSGKSTLLRVLATAIRSINLRWFQILRASAPEAVDSFRVIPAVGRAGLPGILQPCVGIFAEQLGLSQTSGVTGH